MPRYLYPPGPVELRDKQGKTLDPPIVAKILDDGFTIETAADANGEIIRCTSAKSFLKAVKKSRFHMLYYIASRDNAGPVANLGVWTNEEDHALQNGVALDFGGILQAINQQKQVDEGSTGMMLQGLLTTRDAAASVNSAPTSGLAIAMARMGGFMRGDEGMGEDEGFGAPPDWLVAGEPGKGGLAQALAQEDAFLTEEEKVVRNKEREGRRASIARRVAIARAAQNGINDKGEDEAAREESGVDQGPKNTGANLEVAKPTAELLPKELPPVSKEGIIPQESQNIVKKRDDGSLNCQKEGCTRKAMLKGGVRMSFCFPHRNDKLSTLPPAHCVAASPPTPPAPDSVR